MATPPDSTPPSLARDYRAALAALLLGGLTALGSGVVVVSNDRARLDVHDSQLHALEARAAAAEAAQHAQADTLGEVRADIRVMGSQLTGLLAVVGRIEERVSRAPERPAR